MKRYTLLLIAAGLCLTACNSNEKPEKTDSLQYVYVDASEILHVDNKCEDICQTTYGTRPVDVYPVSQIYYVEYEYICSSCIDEKYYSELDISTTNNLKKYYIIAKNEFSDVKTYDDFVRALEYNPEKFYKIFSKIDYVIMPPYQEFCREIAHPNSIAADNQRELFNVLREEYPDIPDSFKKFRESTLNDTNELRLLYNRMKQDGLAFLPEFESLLIDLGLNPNQPAQLKLLLLSSSDTNNTTPRIRKRKTRTQI